MSKEQVLEQALKLGVKERAELASQLLVSLEELSLEENEKLWLEVAERRVQELRSGKVQAIPLADVLKDVESRL
jgi:Putative addiction module component